MATGVLNHFDHDAAADLDYEIDWGPWLDETNDGDYIEPLGATSVPSSGLVLGANGTTISSDGRKTYSWCAACTAGNTYYVRVTVETHNGRIDTRTFYLDAKLL